MAISRRMQLEALVYALGGGLAAVLLIGIPTALIPTPIFGREIPPRPLDYLLLGLTAALTAALAATYALPVACPARERAITAGGLLSFFAVGCPVCNKIVLLLLGSSGALTYFAPIQPLLGLASLGLLAYALTTRLRGVRRSAAC